MLSFDFAGKNSYDDFGILIDKRPAIPSPKRRIDYVTIPGRSSTVKFDPGVYDDMTITVECSVKDDNNLANILDSIKGWLLGSGESDLVFGFQKKRKYMAQVVNNIDFTQTYRVLGEFPIVFNCRPFKYEVENTLITLITPGTITNIGTVFSEPIIKIYGTGKVTFIINGKSVQLTEIIGSFILDSVLQDCYDSNLNNCNNQMAGAFPVFDVGDNSISWSGSVSSVEIAPNWRWL
jgi:predicted phage tail component-like protein